MARRKAIGATLVATVVFGALIVASGVALAGAEQGSMLAVEGSAESRMAAQGQLLMGAALLTLLDRAQLTLSAGVLPCAGTIGAIQRALSGSAVTVAARWLEASAAVESVGDASGHDNESLLGQFAGSQPGLLGISAGASAAGFLGAGFVSYHKQETHLLNLPVDLAGATSLCQAEAHFVQRSLAPLSQDLCNASVAAREVQRLAGTSAERTSHGVFSLHLSLNYDPSTCSVGYVVQVSEAGVVGPLGRFTWSVEQAGSVTGEARQVKPQLA